MIRFVKTPWLIKKWHSSLTWNRNTKDTIYLTFDDGPHPEITPWVIGQLNDFDAKATFFCLGENVSNYPEIAKNLVRRGHRIGNHTYDHQKGWGTTKDIYLKNVGRANEVISKIDLKKPKLFRPPYGRIRRKQIQPMKANFEIIMWSHISWDFIQEINHVQIISQLKKCKSGSILLFHDNEKSFKNLQKILPELLSFYDQKGFKFETL